MFSSQFSKIGGRPRDQPTLPRSFWYLSIAGSAMTLLYFVFGKNDAVGIVQNAPPLLIASYNLFHDLRQPDNAAADVLN